MNPLVSVVIVNYNYGRFLAHCIDTVLAQTYRPIEIIVVDDGSTDDSREVLEHYQERCRVIFQANSGQAAGMNTGVAAATGDIIAFLDSDDGWLPHKLESIVPVLQKHPQVGWLRHKLSMVDETLTSMQRVSPDFSGSRVVRPDHDLLVERLITAGTSVVLRRNAAGQVFPLAASMKFAFDADAVLLARLFAANIWGYSLDDVLGFYRRHAGQSYVGPQDLVRMLNRQIEVGDSIRQILGSRRDSTSAYKHRMIVAALNGTRWWQRDRIANLLDGLQCAVSLAPRPRLFVRQVAALLFAYAAPHAWIRKLEKAQVFANAGGSDER